MGVKRLGLLANALTVSRIVLSILLPFLPPLETSFLVVYAVCGATDVLDGMLARKANAQSRLGARLDSAADFVLAAAMLFSLYPVVKVPWEVLFFIAVIAGIRLASAAVSRMKYRTFASLHTYANKLTGILLFLFPFSLKVWKPLVSVWILCGVAALSATEELLIQVRSKSLDLDRKSIFSKE